MPTIQLISIKGTVDRMHPKPHTVYEVHIQTTVRSWSMWRRYSEFVDLNDELTKSIGAPPPSPLPSKHAWAFRSSFRNAPIVEERKKGLETYLRAIVVSDDLQWRTHHAFCRFLAIPIVNTAPPTGAASRDKNAGGTNARRLTAATRMGEHVGWRAVGRESADSSLERQLADLAERRRVLAEGAEAVYKDGMSQEERQRRMAMVVRLRDDWRDVTSGPSPNLSLAPNPAE